MSLLTEGNNLISGVLGKIVGNSDFIIISVAGSQQADDLIFYTAVSHYRFDIINLNGVFPEKNKNNYISGNYIFINRDGNASDTLIKFGQAVCYQFKRKCFISKEQDKIYVYGKNGKIENCIDETYNPEHIDVYMEKLTGKKFSLCGFNVIPSTTSKELYETSKGAYEIAMNHKKIEDIKKVFSVPQKYVGGEKLFEQLSKQEFRKMVDARRFKNTKTSYTKTTV